MPFEVELKARLRQPEATETKAGRLGPLVEEIFKEDVYFRRQGETSFAPDERYRLRREVEAGHTTTVVTFKEPRSVDGLEVNEEVEFTVDEAHAFFRFADRFGFEPFVVKRKRSRAYKIGRAKVEINQVDHLGHFAEIEIITDDEADIPQARLEVSQVLLRLGLTEADLEPRRYIDLIQQAHPVQYRFINNPDLAWPFEEIP